MSNRNKDKENVRTSVTQPRELWNKLRTDAIMRQKTTDAVLTEILVEHYEAKKP